MRIWLGALLAALLLAGCATTRTETQARGKSVLIFSHSTGYRHEAIEPGGAALIAEFGRRGYRVTRSEDPALFTDEGLAGFDAIVLLDTTTDPKSGQSEWLRGMKGEAFQRWYRHHGAVVGVHAAADSHYGWGWYGRMLGSRFKRHPAGTPAARLTAVPGWGYPASFSVEDEWYELKDLAPDMTVLVTLDPASIAGEEPGPARVVSYTREFAGGRVFYTSLGHRAETFADPRFLDHVSRGLAWTLAR